MRLLKHIYTFIALLFLGLAGVILYSISVREGLDNVINVLLYNYSILGLTSYFINGVCTALLIMLINKNSPLRLVLLTVCIVVSMGVIAFEKWQVIPLVKLQLSTLLLNLFALFIVVKGRL